MQTEFNLKIVSPNGVIADKTVKYVKLKTPSNELGILANHSPLLAKLIKADIEAETIDGKIHKYPITEGFAQVLQNKTVILAND